MFSKFANIFQQWGKNFYQMFLFERFIKTKYFIYIKKTIFLHQLLN